MSRLSPDTKKKLTAVVNFGKTIFHVGFIPTVLYLGIISFLIEFYKFRKYMVQSTFLISTLICLPLSLLRIPTR